MEIQNLIIFLTVGLTAASFAFVLKSEARKKASSFALYKIRDELILLVARGSLSESSPVFQHYYKRTNFILSEAPRFGLDDMLEILIRHKNSNDFEKNISLAEAKAEQMYKAIKDEPEEVRLLISEYYFIQKQMVLAHSSTVKYLYTLALHKKRQQLG